jgi:hypothetical protein
MCPINIIIFFHPFVFFYFAGSTTLGGFWSHWQLSSRLL